MFDDPTGRVTFPRSNTAAVDQKITHHGTNRTFVANVCSIRCHVAWNRTYVRKRSSCEFYGSCVKLQFFANFGSCEQAGAAHPRKFPYKSNSGSCESWRSSWKPNKIEQMFEWQLHWPKNSTN